MVPKALIYVAIARKAMESWFLADTEGDAPMVGGRLPSVKPTPETLAGMPWDRLKELRDEKGRGPGSNRLMFCQKIHSSSRI